MRFFLCASLLWRKEQTLDCAMTPQASAGMLVMVTMMMVMLSAMIELLAMGMVTTGL